MMNYRFNPYRAAALVLLGTAYFLYRWVRNNMPLEHQSRLFDEVGPNHGVVILAMLLITLVGLFKLWANSRNKD